MVSTDKCAECKTPLEDGQECWEVDGFTLCSDDCLVDFMMEYYCPIKEVYHG